MTALELIAKEDLEKFKTELFAELKKLGITPASQQAEKKWLKSSEVRKLLNISPGTLQNLRINGTISYSKIGSLLYYNREELIKMLEENSSKKKITL